MEKKRINRISKVIAKLGGNIKAKEIINNFLEGEIFDINSPEMDIVAGYIQHSHFNNYDVQQSINHYLNYINYETIKHKKLFK